MLPITMKFSYSVIPKSVKQGQFQPCKCWLVHYHTQPQMLTLIFIVPLWFQFFCFVCFSPDFFVCLAFEADMRQRHHYFQRHCQAARLKFAWSRLHGCDSNTVSPIILKVWNPFKWSSRVWIPCSAFQWGMGIS